MGRGTWGLLRLRGARGCGAGSRTSCSAARLAAALGRKAANGLLRGGARGCSMGPRTSGSSRRRPPRPCLLNPLQHHAATIQPTRPTARPVLLTTPLLPCSATTLWALLAAAVTNPIAPLRETYCPRGHGAAEELRRRCTGDARRCAVQRVGGDARAPRMGGAHNCRELRGEGLAGVNGSCDAPSTSHVSLLPLLASTAAAAEASATPTVMSICYTPGGGEEEGRDEQELWRTSCVPTATELGDCHCKIDGEEEGGAAWDAPLQSVTMGQSS